MFSNTVKCGNKLKLWNTIPIFSLTWLTLILFLVISTLWKSIVPSSGFSNKFKHLKSVDLPHPHGPIILITSPFLTSKEIPFSTSKEPKLFFKFLIFSIV